MSDLAFKKGVARKMSPMAIPRGRNKSEPFSPRYLKKIVAMRGPKDKPRLPPTRKREIAVAFFSPLKKLTVLNPSG